MTSSQFAVRKSSAIASPEKIYNQKMPHTLKVVAFIHIKDKKLLQTKNYSQKAFYMPGGKVEEGEDQKLALIREIKEEISIKLLPPSISHYKTFKTDAFNQPKGTKVEISLFFADFEGEIAPSNEIEQIKYFSHSEYLNTNSHVPAGVLIFDNLKKDGLIG